MTPFHEDPRPHGWGGCLLFFIDDAARPVMIWGEMAALPLRYFAIGDDLRLVEYVEALRWEEERKCREMYESMDGLRPTVKKKR